MSDIDPDMLLEWLTTGTGDERDMQVIALEQLCMLLLMSDNVDRCFESCPPRSFLPALCHIFMDESAPDHILEVTARAITYYLDVSAECSRRIVTVDGAVKALCTRLVVVDISSRTSKDLAEQCVKVLELMCTREAGAIYEAGGLNCMLTFIREYGTQIHKDTLHSSMSVVARLCSKMEPTDDTLESCMDSLSKLLQHEDTYVADVALKCFACLADRFTRRGVDPAPLAKHGLTEELLKKLVSSALACNLNTSNSLNASMSESRSNSGNVSIIVSVLSMLCRGSPTVTHDLLRSSLPDAIESAMKGDERCVLDTMRLVDLLLILLFEGRDSLPKNNLPSSRGSLSGLRKLDSSGDKSHRQLIDCIRSKDTDALIEAVDSSTFDVNFMDDVGQTLLNWASAFGTLEMVEFLCERGADVNRGQRSSSLHYAACFGRPAVAKVLLKHGANPELRDEDGKTPLDKSRERNDEGHKEVVRILQSPGEWMGVTIDTAVSELSTQHNEASADASDNTEDNKPVIEDVVKGDPEMAPIYVKRLVPVFVNTYQGSLVASIKKATLSILKKMIHYIPAVMMEELVSGNVAPKLVDVIAMALNTEADDEGYVAAFHCVQDLMTKGPHIFLIHFIRLGVLQRITEMSSELDEVNDEDLISGKIMQKEEPTIPLEDATNILSGQPYHWHDWCFARGRDCLYLWSDFCAIELSNGSNGWFRFVLDGKLATMYSSGSPEGGSGSSESRTEFLDKLQRARSAVPSGSVSRPVLSSSGAENIIVGNWTLSCRQENQLSIINTDGQQATILKEDLPGFLFESNRGTKHTFTAETSLGPDFAFSWSGKSGKKFQSKKEQIRIKLSSLARTIYCKYFKDADLTPHGSMASLVKISETLSNCISPNGQMSEMMKEKITATLHELCKIIEEETMLSAYEIQTSGLVTALNNCLNRSLPYSHYTLGKDCSESSEIFKRVFGAAAKNMSTNDTVNDSGPAITLIRKLIMVLETSEKLPVLTYENLGGGSGLQILLHRLRFKLEHGNKSTNFIDHSGRFIKMEPLTTVKEVEKYILKMVSKQWYDYERSTFKFVQHFKECPEPLEFKYESDFDENGIMYWVGTNAKKAKDWVNPARHSLVVVTSSEGRSLPYGRLEDVLSRDSPAINCHTNDDKSAWFNIDTGLYIIPTHYSLRHSRGYGRSALRNWFFQVSNDGTTWTTLKTHENDESLQEPGSTTTWQVEIPETETTETGWHMMRIQQNGTNASGQTYYLSVSGFEVYGKVTSVIETLKLPTIPESETQKRQRRVFRSQILRHMALGAKEGSDWKLLRDQARAKSMADENKNNGGWVDVSWAQNVPSTSKQNNDNTFNVKVMDISDPDVQMAMLKAEKRGKNENNRSLHHTTLDNALKQVLLSFGKKNEGESSKSDSKTPKADNSQIAHSSKTNPDEPSTSTGTSTETNSRIDLANLQFAMAVEGLLDSSSSDLVASALAEAASMRVDQLRLATQFRSTLLESSKGRPTPSAQGSRESQSPPTEPSGIPLLGESSQFAEEIGNAQNNNIDEPVSSSKQLKNDSENNASSSTDKPVLPPSILSEREIESLLSGDGMNQISQITSSMSEVLSSMNIQDKDDNSNNEETFTSFEPCNVLNVDYDESQTENSLSVAENNFLNDNHNVLEPDVIYDDCCESDDDNDDEDEDEQGETHLVSHDPSTDDHISVRYELLSSDQDANTDSFKNYINTKSGDSLPGVTIVNLHGNGESSNMESIDGYVGSSDKTVKSRETTQITPNSLIQLLGQGSSSSQNSENISGIIDNIMNGDESESKDFIGSLLGIIPSKDLDEDGLKELGINIDLTPPVEVVDNNEKTIETVDVEFHSHIKTDEDSLEMNIDMNNERNEESASATDVAETTVGSDKQVVAPAGDALNNVSAEENLFSLQEILQVHQSSPNDKNQSKGNDTKTDAVAGPGTSSSDASSSSNVTKQSDVLKLMPKEDLESIEDMEVDEDEDEEEDDEDDDDDDFDDNDIENEDENDPEDMYEPMNDGQNERHYDHQRRMWDDDLILKCTHSALVPAFDPRPGRTNVQPTQDIEIPVPDPNQAEKESNEKSNIALFIRGTPYPGAKEVEIPLDNPNATVFSFVQTLVLHGASGLNQSERLRRVWEPMFTFVYKSTDGTTILEEEIKLPKESEYIKWETLYVKDNIGKFDLPKSDVINYLQQNCDADFLRKWKLTGPTKSCRKQRNCAVLIAAYKEFASKKLEEALKDGIDTNKEKVFQIEEPVHRSLEEITPIQSVLDVVRSLYGLSEDINEKGILDDDYLFDVASDEFLSKKITNKLVQQIQDPLALASGSLPLWCEYLVINYPFLFPFDIRQMFFKATAFGCSRSIVWLQNMQDVALERSRGHPTRRLETHEFRIGRMKHERVTVPRGTELLETAIRLMDFHAERKAILEIEFKEEEGTGLGPSLEFYALISTALQQSSLSLWVSLDETMTQTNFNGMVSYSYHPNGLFPAPIPQDCERIEEICKMFTFLGIFLAKCLQDNRLVDIPLSQPFFKMLCAGKGKYSRLSRTLSQTSEMTATDDDFDEDEVDDDDDDSLDDIFDPSMLLSVHKLDSHYFSDVLTDTDFELIHPNKAKFVKQLQSFINKRKCIMNNKNLNDTERKKQLDEIMFETEHGHSCDLSDLGLNFQYIPSSTIYGFDSVELKPGGNDELLCAENAEEYIDLLKDFTMHKGIAKQLEAFRAGFNRVFPMEKLHAFKQHEVQLMLCGEQAPKWTYDELMLYTEPKYGYHKDSPVFIRLLEVLVDMSGNERKDFLQFATGCSSLPPGGIANLHPRLTVVKKEGEGDGSFPSVNTCVHYLKLPEYSSKEMLRTKLLAATKEKSFHLN